MNGAIDKAVSVWQMEQIRHRAVEMVGPERVRNIQVEPESDRVDPLARYSRMPTPPSWWNSATASSENLMAAQQLRKRR